MRVLVYAASAYVWCAGAHAASSAPSAALAFVPKGGGDVKGAPSTRAMGRRTAPVVRMEANNDDATEVMTRADAKMGNAMPSSGGNKNMHTVSAPFNASYSSPSQAKDDAAAGVSPQYKTGFNPPMGYTPRPRAPKPSADTHGAAVFQRVVDMMGSDQGSQTNSKLASGKTEPMNSAPAKKWQVPVGYVPKGERNVHPNELASTSQPSKMDVFAPEYKASGDGKCHEDMEMTSALAKKWQPYGGYEPKRDRPAVPAPAAAVWCDAAADAAADARASYEQPARRWQAPVGYVPKGNRPASPEPQVAQPKMEVASTSQPSQMDMSSSANAKELLSYGGYTHKGDRPATPEPAARPYTAPATRTDPAQTYGVADSLTSAPAKKWQVYSHS